MAKASYEGQVKGKMERLARDIRHTKWVVRMLKRGNGEDVIARERERLRKLHADYDVLEIRMKKR